MEDGSPLVPASGGGNGNTNEWHPALAVVVALIFAAPAIALAIVVDPIWGPAGYAAVLGPIWLFVHRLLTGGRPRPDGS